MTKRIHREALLLARAEAEPHGIAVRLCSGRVHHKLEFTFSGQRRRLPVPGTPRAGRETVLLRERCQIRRLIAEMTGRGR